MSTETQLPVLSEEISSAESSVPESAGKDQSEIDNEEQVIESDAKTEEKNTVDKFTVLQPEGIILAGKDINAKLDDLDSGFQSLSQQLERSNESSRSRMDDLAILNAKLTAEIDQLGSNFAEKTTGYAQQLTRVQQRFSGSLVELGIEIKKAAADIREQQSELNDLRVTQSEILSVQEEAQASARRQQISISQLSDLAQERAEKNQSRIESLTLLQDEQRTALNKLVSDFVSLEARTGEIAGSLSKLNADIIAFEHKTGRNFRIVGATGAVFCLLFLLLTGYFQYYPLNASEAVKSNIKTISAQLEQQTEYTAVLQSQIDLLGGGLQGVAGDIDGVVKDISGIKQSLTDNALITARLESANRITSEQLATMTAAHERLRKDMDDLEFRINGPSNRNGGVIESVLDIQDERWIAVQNASHYAIQLVGVYRQQNLVAYANQNAHVLKEYPLSYNRGKYLGRDWYNLFYGDFATFDAAQDALDKLPLRLQTNNPWVRSFSSVQKVTSQ